MNLPKTMKAMVLEKAEASLIYKTLPLPRPSSGQVLVKVMACGICRTDLHILDGELPSPKLPLIPGHEIIGTVVKAGEGSSKFKEGELVGIPWLAYTCGKCRYCKSGRENLCDNALFTGYTLDGGFAEFTLAFENYCFRLPKEYADPRGAPLMCAGLIGFRSYNMLDRAVNNIGFYGFGAAAHILIQVAAYKHKKVFAFTRPGDKETQRFATSLGAAWAGDSSEPPPEKLDAAIIFAPIGNLIPKALEDTGKGGTVICGGIHMSEIPSFPYQLLWEERSLRSVANLTRNDGETFLKIAPEIPIKTEVTLFSLQQANEAIGNVRAGRIKGAAVLVMDQKYL